MEHWTLSLYHMLLALLMMGAIDLFVARFTRARWYFLHACVNFVVAGLSLADVAEGLRNPVGFAIAAPGVDHTMWPCYWIAGLHFYHLIAFRNLPLGDWVHHLGFGVPIVLLGVCFPWGPGQNVVSFFISGLPGGIDYVFLVMRKYDMITSEFEKTWNARINVWLRAPGLTICTFCMYLSYIHMNPGPDFFHGCAMLTLALLCFINGQYYMQVVVGNTYQKVPTHSS